MEALSIADQISEIRDEFHEEAQVYKQTRSQTVLNHINALLDCYLELLLITQLAEGYDGA